MSAARQSLYFAHISRLVLSRHPHLCRTGQQESSLEARQAFVASSAQQDDELQQQLSAQASDLKSSKAAVEYVQRLLNAVTAENGDLRKQLVKHQALQQSGGDVTLQRTSSSGIFLCP